MDTLQETRADTMMRSLSFSNLVMSTSRIRLRPANYRFLGPSRIILLGLERSFPSTGFSQSLIMGSADSYQGTTQLFVNQLILLWLRSCKDGIKTSIAAVAIIIVAATGRAFIVESLLHYNW
jgi:hypothetical protein